MTKVQIFPTKEYSSILYPFHHANIILPIIPVPLFRIHVIAAAKGVAFDSPTPIPFIIE